MSSCAVKTCKNHFKKLKVKSSGVTFHVFPKDPKAKEKWLKAVCREDWFPGPRTTICSEHFVESCFDLSKKRRYLLSNSIPTLKLDFDQNEKEDAMQVQAAATDVPGASMDTPRIKKLMSRIACLEHVSRQRLLKIKRLQENQRRLKRKICKMQNLFQELKKK